MTGSPEKTGACLKSPPMDGGPDLLISRSIPVALCFVSSLLTACGHLEQASSDPVAPSRQTASKPLVTKKKKPANEQNTDTLSAEDQEIARLLKEAHLRRDRERQSRQAAADFHHKIALKFFTLSVGQSDSSPSRISDLNQALANAIATANANNPPSEEDLPLNAVTALRVGELTVGLFQKVCSTLDLCS